jgi:hypothetical protein
MLYAQGGPYIIKRCQKPKKPLRNHETKLGGLACTYFYANGQLSFIMKPQWWRIFFYRTIFVPNPAILLHFFSCLLKALGITTICTQSWIVTVYMHRNNNACHCSVHFKLSKILAGLSKCKNAYCI